jgi:hypothetical protein
MTDPNSMTDKERAEWLRSLPTREGMTGALAAAHEEALKAVELDMPTEAKELLMRIIALANSHGASADKEEMAKRLSRIQDYALRALGAIAQWKPAEPMRRDMAWRLDAIIAVSREKVDCRSRDEKARE